MKKTFFILSLLTVLEAATLTTVFPHSQLASADPDRKFKSWVTKDKQFGVSACCEEANDDCKQFKEALVGDNVNKGAKE